MQENIKKMQDVLDQYPPSNVKSWRNQLQIYYTINGVEFLVTISGKCDSSRFWNCPVFGTSDYDTYVFLISGGKTNKKTLFPSHEQITSIKPCDEKENPIKPVIWKDGDMLYITYPFSEIGIPVKNISKIVVEPAGEIIFQK